MAREATQSQRFGNEEEAEAQDDRQSSQQGGDLDQDPKFRKWKSTMDRQLAQANQVAQQARLEAERVRREREDELMRNMDELERSQFLAKRLQEENERLRNEQQLAYKAFERQAELYQIVNETGISMEDIENLPTAREAWNAGIRHLKQQDRHAVQQQVEQNVGDERRQRPPVDLGSGMARPSDREEWQKEYERLKKSGNATALYAHYEKFRW
jgi:hypothetical protein